MRHMAEHSAARTDVVIFEVDSPRGIAGFKARQHSAWLAVWQRVDLSRLPGYPFWEREVFEVLQACWPELRSIFHFYCKRGRRCLADQPDQMNVGAFLLWSEDCRIRTKMFPQARIQVRDQPLTLLRNTLRPVIFQHALPQYRSPAPNPVGRQSSRIVLCAGVSSRGTRCLTLRTAQPWW